MRIFRSTTGINNKVDPARHKFEPETGLAELTAGINIDIDRYGGIDRRLGQSVVVDDVFHSGYCNGGDAYVVQDRTNDAAIYQIATDDSLTGIASGLTKGYRVSFWQVGTYTYWMNGAQQGLLYAGGNYAWPTVATHIGVYSSAEYYPAPLGTHICVFRGMMCVVVGNTIYVSEPYSFGEYRMASMYWQFPSDVTMIKPVAGGLWVSDSDQVGFIQAAEKFADMTWVKKATVPAHEWSECIMLADLSQTVLQVPGLSALWSCDEGMCYGSEAGDFKVFTKDKLVYPIGGAAATVMFGDMVINSVGQTTISETNPELFSNGAFTTSIDGLTAYTGTAEWSALYSGSAKFVTSSYYGGYITVPTTVGQIYEITCKFQGHYGRFRVGASLGTYYVNVAVYEVNLERTVTFKATTATTYIHIGSLNETVTLYLEYISVKATTNRVENGEFSSDRLWTKGTGLTISGGTAVAAAGEASSLTPNPALTIVAGTRYVVTYTMTRSAGSITPTIGGVTLATKSAAGTYTALITALSTANLSFNKDASFAGTIDNVSVVPYDEYDGTLPITT